MEIGYKTSIPLFTAVAVIPAIVVAVFWVATLSARVSAAEQRTDRVVDKIHIMEGKEDKILDVVIDLRERLARIEERINR